MTMKSFRGLTASFLVAAMSFAPLAAGLMLVAEPAFAQKGGNGNGNGNGRRAERENGNGNRSSERGNNGRGAIASELKGLNAAHASQNALENASPDSMPGKLYAYQQAVLSVEAKEQAVKDTEELYLALQDMTEERFLELNPSLDYASTLSEAGLAYQSALNEYSLAENEVEGSLLILTDGRRLSSGALSELERLLGL